MCDIVCAVNECPIRLRGGCYCECLQAYKNNIYEPLNINTKPIEVIYGGVGTTFLEDSND
jgi:hypothetical protein